MFKRLFAPFVVVAHFDGRTAKHYARNMSDALSWVACYPVGDRCEVFERHMGRTALIPVAIRA